MCRQAGFLQRPAQGQIVHHLVMDRLVAADPKVVMTVAQQAGPKQAGSAQAGTQRREDPDAGHDDDVKDHG